MNIIKLALIMISLFVTSLFSQQIEFLNPRDIDVGKIHEGKRIEGAIRFVVLGETPITIKNVRTSCGCTAAKPDKEVYATGDTAEVSYTIKTDGFSGNIHKSIRIDLEGAEVSNASFTIHAVISKDINITPGYLQFRQVSLDSDSSVTEFFEIQNDMDLPVEIKKVTVYNDLIKVVPEKTVIPPHKSHLFQVKLSPPKEAGKYDTRISIESDYTKRPVMYLPVFIQVRS
jgi:hypothetical protein